VEIPQYVQEEELEVEVEVEVLPELEPV